MSIQNTACLLVTCALEETRLQVLEQVVANLKSQPDQAYAQHLVVFDNGSTVDGNDKLLSENFQHVYKSSVNTGFWSAIWWFLQNYQEILGRDYEYLYIIESDMIHTDGAFERLQACEDFLTSYPGVGLVRLEEFSIKERHLYDKAQCSSKSRKYAWVEQFNRITGRHVEFELADENNGIYTCNFLAKLPALTRMSAMKDVFMQLTTMGVFEETDFRRCYHRLFPVTAILDGGIWHSKLGNDDAPALKGSRPGKDTKQVGYKWTQEDRIVPIDPSWLRRLTP